MCVCDVRKNSTLPSFFDAAYKNTHIYAHVHALLTFPFLVSAHKTQRELAVPQTAAATASTSAFRIVCCYCCCCLMSQVAPTKQPNVCTLHATTLLPCRFALCAHVVACLAPLFGTLPSSVCACVYACLSVC